ncbi:sodium-dependent transporter [Acidaminobacter sp.]|uniref:sodium-dependent transporter n=1 Tax=Acidaminobacter sp. TaxID=1872102 RepID=UPI002564D0C5|nr:sodium-dependent transporter [Acidaminobacter sp.]MDK9711089.1 sodium-dependent transporter [Acidaminobacter sp.]
MAVESRVSAERIQDQKPRDQFKSQLGFIFAAAGSAVGLGNIWRFPYMTGTNGGGAFVLLYLICVLFVGASLLLVEFAIGRNGKTNAIESYAKIRKGAKWIGFLGFFSAFIFLSYYSVVSGWTVYYSIQSFFGLNGLAPDQIGNFFGAFISDPVKPLMYHGIFMALTVGIIIKGVSQGIEKSTKIMMPMLFVLLIILVIRALTLPGAWEGIKWYLTPDLSKITGGVWIAALGQVFFSMSVGMSGMVTYASYLGKHENLPKTSIIVALMDTSVALLAGLIIFPAVFSFGLEPGAGPGLVFITLPAVFAQMPLGSIFSFMFFVLLAIACLTSSISILEMPVSYLIETRKMARTKAALLVGAIAYVMGIAVSFSFGIWSDFTLFGKGIFDLFDYFGSNISLPLGGLAAAILVGWFWGEKDAVAEISNNGEIKGTIVKAWFPVVKYVVPVTVVLIFLSNLGILKL